MIPKLTKVFHIIERSNSFDIQIQTEKWKDKLKGGLADKNSPKDFDPEQLAAGIKVEMEHTDSKKIAAEIAMDHLSEDPEYYEKLKAVEND